MIKNEVTQRDFAKILGKTEGLISQYKRDGRLVFNGSKVLVKESKQRLKETAHMNGWVNEQHAAKERNEINKQIADEAAGKTYDDLKTDVNASQLDLETTDAKILFENARALREKSTALQAAAEHEKFIGNLVSKELVEKIMFERARAFRDALMTSSRRMAPLVSGKDDISQIESMLNEEYRRILEEFAKMPIIND